MNSLIIVILISFGDTLINQEIPEAYNYITNYGLLGGERCLWRWGMSWPGAVFNNWYAEEVEFAVGTKINGIPYVTTNYFNWHPYFKREWNAGEIIYHGPGVSEEDIVLEWNDYISNPYNLPGRHTGIKVICRTYTWSYEPWNDFIPYEFFVIWNKSECDIPNVPDTLDSLFIGILCDFDISGSDPTDPYNDDLAFFDGYVAHEWDTLGYPYDSITLLPDTFLSIPDGIYDQYIVYGNDSLEHTIHGDTLILPRNLGFMWDDDDPMTPGNDKGEEGASAGYVGVALLYSPPSPADTTWICNYCGDTCRIPRVWASRWWVSTSHPSDTLLYQWLSGDPIRFQYKYFLATPLMWCSISSGPFKIADRETLKFVFVLAVGQGMNGGNDLYWQRNWIRGLRQTIDYALTAYYAGSEISDPYHPSGPDEDIHWKILSISEKNYKRISLNFPTILNSSYILKTKEPLKIKIYNASGRKISEILVKDKGMPFKNLKGGIYFIKINKKEFKKFIILR